MRSVLAAISIVVTGYLIGAAGGYAAVLAFSGNAHDRNIEAAMTGAFVTGPLLAILAFSLWIGRRVWKRRRTV